MKDDGIKAVTADLQMIGEELGKELNGDDVSALMTSLNKLSALGSNMAFAEGRAKVIADRSMADKLKGLRSRNDSQGVKMSPNELRDFAKAMAGDEIGLYDMAVNLDRFLSKRIDSLRTMISMKKSELENNMSQSQ